MIRAIALITVLGLLATTTSAENWPGWRGPTSNGVAAGDGFPTKWNQEENIDWKVDLPGRGGSTPAVWENTIFVTSGDEGKNLLLALDRSGNETWRLELGSERPGKHKKGSGAKLEDGAITLSATMSSRISRAVILPVSTSTGRSNGA